MIRNTIENKQRLLKSLKKHLGVVTYACNDAKITRKTFYVYHRDDEDFRNSVEEINEMSIDLAENELFKKIKEGSEKSIHFLLKHKGKKRGYTDSVDITTNGDKIISDINVNIILPKLDNEYDD